MSPFTQPLSDIVPAAPTEAPFIRSGFHLLPLKMKNGGNATPIALAQPITVVVVLLGEVICCTLVPTDPMTFGGLCSG